MLTRRDVLQRAGTATALATTAPWWLVRRAHAARQTKLVVWNPAALAPQVDKIMQEQCYAYAKQAGIKENEIDYSIIGGWPTPAQTGRGARGREPAGYHPVGRWIRAALPLAGPPPGGDRRGRQDAESARGALPGLPPECHVSGQGLWRAAVRQPLAADHPPGSPRGRQGRSPQDVGGVHRGLQEAAKAAQAHRLWHVPGPAKRYRQQRDEHDLVLWRQARRGRQQDRGAALPGHRGSRATDCGHVHQAQDHPEGRDRVGQYRQQQSLSVTAGALRPESHQHLCLSGGLRQRAVQRHGTAAGAGGARRARSRNSARRNGSSSSTTPIRRWPKGSRSTGWRQRTCG